ncbi:MAG: trypsin-like peptidase domain-containing protein, partial [Leeuwenhoekiella sp.]
MKKFASLLGVALLSGGITLGGYTLLKNETEIFSTTEAISAPISTVSYKGNPISSTNADFTEAADRTVHAVVHVKNVQMVRSQRRWGEMEKGLAGAGSGVIISGDGYIVTNNHVIQGASELQVSLNDNRTYMAEVIGTDEGADIALLKVDTDEDLPYLPFGDSDSVRIGEWALAVGNPFNLTSTVTAGIISAKGRDINPEDDKLQSFIQTDAAINPGNSGGALVNINGELIGINTAITSQTGSYIGYGFAVPSNNARKIVEDIMLYGEVRKAYLGISGTSLQPQISEELEISEVEGVYIAGVEFGSGAAKAGLQEGDVIKNIDGIRITSFADLTGYINSKSADDAVQVLFVRDGAENNTTVTLNTIETYALAGLGFELKGASPE